MNINDLSKEQKDIRAEVKQLRSDIISYLDSEVEENKVKIDNLMQNLGATKDMLITLQERMRKIDNWLNKRPI